MAQMLTIQQKLDCYQRQFESENRLRKFEKIKVLSNVEPSQPTTSSSTNKSSRSKETSYDSIRKDSKRQRLSDRLERPSYSEPERDRTDHSYRLLSPSWTQNNLHTQGHGPQVVMI